MVAARLATLQDGQRKSASPIGEAVSQSEAASMLNVGKRSVERGAKLKAWHAVRAKERQIASLKKGAAPVPANLPGRAEGDARDHAAKAVGVGGKLIDQAENVMRKAVPRLRPALDFTGAGAPDRARIDERVRGGIDLPERH